MTYRLAPAAIAALAIGLAGCIPSEAPTPGPTASPQSTPAPPAPGATPQEESEEQEQAAMLMAEWNELAARENPLRNMGETRMFEIAAHLKVLGDEFLYPLVDTLGNTEAPRETRHLALFTLQHEMSAALTDRLQPLTTPDHDKYARSMATQLIAFMRDESVQPILEQLAQDEEPMVQFTATLGLALLGSKEAKDSLFAKLNADVTSFAEQDRIVQTLAEDPDPNYVTVYSSALKNPILEFQSLLLSAKALAEVGGPDDIAVLENLNPTITGTDVLNAARDAIAQIKERHNLPDNAAEKE